MRNLYDCLRYSAFVSTLFLFFSAAATAQVYTATTLAGGGTQPYSNDISVTSVALTPQSVYADKGGYIYFVNGNWVVFLQYGEVVTFAGTGVAGYSGDGGPAVGAQLNQPYGICQDPKGNFYIGSRGDNRIRMVGTDGNIHTFAGNGSAGYTGDGGLATQASLEGINGIWGDAKGNILVSDSIAGVIRKIDTNGIITTIAGTGTPGYSGDGGLAKSAQLGHPNGIGVDAIGNIYIGDDYVNTVRRIDTNGIITTIAGGSTTRGYSGDYFSALSATFGNITNIYVNDEGNVFIVDPTTSSIREYGVHTGNISPFTGPNGDTENVPQTSVCQSFPSGLFYVTNSKSNTIDQILIEIGLPLASDTMTQYIHAPYFPGNITNYYNSYIIYTDTAALDWYHFPSFVPTQAGLPLTNLPQGLYTFIDAVDTGFQQYSGVPVTPRHFEIIGPSGEDTTTQDEVELWFQYQDFVDYDNYVAAHNLNLPRLTTLQGQNLGIYARNFRIVDFHGAASTPQSPTGSVEVLTPEQIGPDVNYYTFQNLGYQQADDLYSIIIRCAHGFSNFYLATDGAFPLPLTLLSFTGTPQGTDAMLHWTTTNEVNTQTFFVQRSPDTTAFATFGSVAAQNTAGTNSYGYTDKGLAPGTYFYRLKMQDITGNYTYSPIVEIPIGSMGVGSILLYPNPAKDLVYCQLQANVAENCILQLTDRQGNILQTQATSLNPGETTLSFNIATLPAGSYFIIAAVNGQKVVEEFMK